MVEASLIIPIVIFCILAVIYFTILLYQQAYVQSLANEAVERGAAYWSNAAGDIGTGRIVMDDLGRQGLYWRLFDSNKDGKIKTIQTYVSSGRAGSYNGRFGIDSSSLLKSADRNKNERVVVELADYIIYKKLTLTVRDTYKIPVGGFLKGFGLNDGFPIEAKSEAVINEPVEFIRNTDFLLGTEKELERKYPGLQNIMDKARDLLNGINGKITDFFK